MTKPSHFWLMKTEPESFGIDDLAKKQRESWDGVRNYRARNFMRDQMTLGDLILFYHSSTTPPGVAGIARVASKSYPDPSQFKVGGQYYDAKSSKNNPRWWLVDVEFVEKFPFITLASLRDDPAFDGMWLLRRGMRLSVQPVEPDHFARIVRLGGGKTRIRRA